MEDWLQDTLQETSPIRGEKGYHASIVDEILQTTAKFVAKPLVVPKLVVNQNFGIFSRTNGAPYGLGIAIFRSADFFERPKPLIDQIVVIQISGHLERVDN